MAGRGISAALADPVPDARILAVKQAAGFFPHSPLKKAPTHFPLFWNEPSGTWYTKTAGLILTSAVVPLGAPFWFDMLNKLVSLRQAGLPPDDNRRQSNSSGMVSQ